MRGKTTKDVTRVHDSLDLHHWGSALSLSDVDETIVVSKVILILDYRLVPVG